jgi:non-canonical (house-cleaning) NTP pyrophosphatase
MPNFVETDRMQLQASFDPATVERPTIVCLCGSTRFWRTFQRAGLQETMKGNIVLSIGAAAGTDDEHFGNLKPEAYEAVKDKLDVLHYHKIYNADEILVLDELQDGHPYIGTSTKAEIAFARRQSKHVRYWSQEQGLEYPLKVVVGSTSELKLTAVRDSFVGISAEVVGCRAPSGIAEQPEGVPETYLGVNNRLEKAQELIPDADIYIAIESGVYLAKDTWYDWAIVLLASPKFEIREMAETESTMMPTHFVNLTLNRPGGFQTNTVGQVMHEENSNVIADDPHRYIAGISRGVLLERAVKKVVEGFVLDLKEVENA